MKKTTIDTLPALLGGTGDIQVYEVNQELCMSAEDIGKLLGYNDPEKAMDQLYQRNKDELSEYRFSPQIEGKTSPKKTGGRPSIFYVEDGIYIACMLAQTENAKVIRMRIARTLRHLRLQRRLQLQDRIIDLQEKLASKYTWVLWTKEEKATLKKMAADGCSYIEVAETLGRKKCSVANLYHKYHIPLYPRGKPEKD